MDDITFIVEIAVCVSILIMISVVVFESYKRTVIIDPYTQFLSSAKPLREQPLAIIHHPDGSSKFIVVENSGKARTVNAFSQVQEYMSYTLGEHNIATIPPDLIIDEHMASEAPQVTEQHGEQLTEQDLIDTYYAAFPEKRKTEPVKETKQPVSGKRFENIIE